MSTKQIVKLTHLIDSGIVKAGAKFRCKKSEEHYGIITCDGKIKPSTFTCDEKYLAPSSFCLKVCKLVNPNCILTAVSTSRMGEIQNDSDDFVSYTYYVKQYLKDEYDSSSEEEKKYRSKRKRDELYSDDDNELYSNEDLLKVIKKLTSDNGWKFKKDQKIEGKDKITWKITFIQSN
jgi:hypothetical protein